MIYNENEIAQRIATVRAQIERATEQAGREVGAVSLMLVTKTVEAKRIIQALECGEHLIGENKVQELQDKQARLEGQRYEAHLIGHLQTNKVKEVIGYAQCIQSLDRLKLADKLQQRLEFEDKTIEALVQVNTSAEASKFGVAPDKALALIGQLRDYERINIRGLMTIATYTEDEREIRRCFQLLKTLQQKAQQRYGDYGDFKTLSMGMSKDMKIAIEEGSTIVRLGRAIFGARD
ncbi:YggS family pyridoxal phosphate-dependent enzyme [Rappaport israeli]|uniref:YggS family pyridoxal phosphate-dependent enzyme n=1 Tax=Rappaport israeli TaxID=1839807 RepID=UPI000930C90F|nr:YggS family pyridoxal phosphate-dependent enzyme [Rappaport israeli]